MLDNRNYDASAVFDAVALQSAIPPGVFGVGYSVPPSGINNFDIFILLNLFGQVIIELKISLGLFGMFLVLTACISC